MSPDDRTERADRTETPSDGDAAIQATVEPLAMDEIRNLTGVKWRWFDDDVFPAWVADMDIRPPSCVIDTLADLVQRGDFGYNRRASALLPKVFADWQRKQHAWSVDPADVRLFCDVLHAVDVALWLHTEPGDGVVLFTPIYPPFLAALEGAHRRLIDVPLDPDGWRLDPDRLRAAIDDRTRVILMCNPHNPTGRVFDHDELSAIAEVALERDLVVLSDEVWADLVHPGAVHRPMASLGDEIAARTVTITSASKAFNLAGLRCAVAHMGHRGIAADLDALPRHLLGAVSTPGAEAAVAAWTEGEAWLSALRAHLLARRDQLLSRLADELPAVRVHPPQATYLSWLDFRDLGLGDNPTERLLDVARVGLSSGPDFGPGGGGFARLNFATSESILDELLNRITAAVNG